LEVGFAAETRIAFYDGSGAHRTSLSRSLARKIRLPPQSSGRAGEVILSGREVGNVSELFVKLGSNGLGAFVANPRSSGDDSDKTILHLFGVVIMVEETAFRTTRTTETPLGVLATSHNAHRACFVSCTCAYVRSAHCRTSSFGIWHSESIHKREKTVGLRILRREYRSTTTTTTRRTTPPSQSLPSDQLAAIIMAPRFQKGPDLKRFMVGSPVTKGAPRRERSFLCRQPAGQRERSRDEQATAELLGVPYGAGSGM
jgi:hypothetical protein